MTFWRGTLRTLAVLLLAIQEQARVLFWALGIINGSVPKVTDVFLHAFDSFSKLPHKS